MYYESGLKQRLYESGILPQLDSHSILSAAQAAAELARGGISAILLENGPQLAWQIKDIRAVRPDILVGVLVKETGLIPLHEKADFYLMKAGSDIPCADKAPTIPVCNSASEIERCAARGETAAVIGYPISLDALHTLYETLPQVSFILDIGSEELAEAYLKESNVLAVLNRSILTRESGSTEGDIAQRASDAVNRAYGITTGHLGINTENREQAITLADQLSALFGIPWRETPKSFLIGGLVEIMKMPYLGEKGHMGFLTNDLQRTIRFYRTKGAAFNMATYEKNAIVYFAQEYGGVAFHLTERPKEQRNEVL